MKKKKFLWIAGFLLSTISTFSQNADILWHNGIANGRDYQAASFLVDNSAIAGSTRGLVVVAKNWDTTALANRRFLTVDQFDVSGNFLFPGKANAHANVPTTAISATKIIKTPATVVKRYYALGHINGSPNIISGGTALSTNAILVLDDGFNIISQFKLHYNTLTAAKRVHILRFFDMILLADGNLLLCGYMSVSTTATKQLLLCKVSPAGAVLWSGVYPPAPNCNIIAYSAAQATSGRILVTGTIDSCGTTFKHLWVAKFDNATGAFINGIRYINTTREMVGYKIVRLQSGPVVGADRFMITGAIDVSTLAGGATDRQILLLDINEAALNANTMNWVGGFRTELGNDLIFRQNAANQYSLFLTGYTNSFSGAVPVDEPYFLRVRYSTLVNSVPSVSEFSTFPNSAYPGRYGLEIKKASGTKFAILANTLRATGAGQTRFYSSMLIRDTTDITSNCIKIQQPQIVRVGPVTRPLTFTKFDTLLAYTDTWANYEIVRRDSICGVFKVDPPSAVPTGNVDQVPRRITIDPQAEISAALPGLTIYPNPAKDKLVITWNNLLQPGRNVNLEVLSPQMKRVQMKQVTQGNTTQLSISQLPAGVYFLRIRTGEQSGLLRFVKQ
jgi:Secretion system C-terminal sorting domain